MTTRPGNAALGLHSNGHRTKKLCNLVKIVRTDGLVVRISDHDRKLTFEGEVYTPAVFSGMSMESREAALKTPGQELHGVIDGDTMLVPDLLGQRYRGAAVYHVITDWQYPWLAIARHYKSVRAVRWDGLKFVAMLDGRTQILERPAGGRLGGVMSKECPYVYGDATTCKKDLAAAGEIVFGVKVETVSDSRLEFTVTAASLTGSFDDDFWRDGEIDWRWGEIFHAAQGTVAVGLTTLTQAPSPGWTVDEHAGRAVLLLSAVDGYVVDRQTILSNTASTLTFAALESASAGVYRFEIAEASDNALVVSPIIRSVHSSRTFELFAPTPFNIEVGHRGHLRAGCNGLFSTCKTKSNSINFGGNHLQPQPGDLLEVIP